MGGVPYIGLSVTEDDIFTDFYVMMCRNCGFRFEQDDLMDLSSSNEEINKKEVMSLGKKSKKKKVYLAGEIDLGILGKRPAYLFENENREKSTHPVLKMVIKDGDEWKQVGAFWVREVKQKEEVDDTLGFIG